MPSAVFVGRPDDVESLDAESLALKTGAPVTVTETRRRTCCSNRCLNIYMAPVLTLLLLSNSAVLLTGHGGLPPLMLMVEPRLRNSNGTATTAITTATAPETCGNIKPWNGTSPVELGWSDGAHRCGWQQLNGTDLKMCIRGYKDMVSDRLRKYGHWSDCDALLTLWDRLPDRSLSMPAKTGATACHGSTKIFVDIGANVGACTFPMAAKKNVPAVVSFEPVPSNLFYLTSTIVEGKLQDKVHVYPMALGEEHGDVKIYADANPGSSVLGKPAMGTEKLVATVKVALLQDIFTAASLPYIHVMKMDAQGYEVNINPDL